MKSKKTYRTIVRDLRDIDPTKIAVPGVSGEFASRGASPSTEDTHIVASGIGVHTSGQTTHE